MALPADITTAITAAGTSVAANETVVVGLVGVAQETNMTEVHVLDDLPATPADPPPGTKDVRVTVTLRSTGVSKAIADDLLELFALTRGTR